MQPMVDAAKGKLLGVLTDGHDAPAIAAGLRGRLSRSRRADARRRGFEGAQNWRSGDTVLLSPACASYDQFNHFEHRGDTFKSRWCPAVSEGTLKMFSEAKKGANVVVLRSAAARRPCWAWSASGW